MIRFVAHALRRLLAAIVLLALLVGAPWALWNLGRPHLPNHLPGVTEVWAALTERDTGQILLGTLTIIGFAAWAVFAISVAAEAAAAITHTPAIRLPGLRLPQTLAAGLIALIITTSPALAAPAHAATLPALPNGAVAAVAVQTPPMTDAAADSTALRPTLTHDAVPGSTRSWPAGRPTPAHSADQGSNSGPTWTVQKGDTLWDIAEVTLGDPLRCTEIGELNRGHIQPDGKTFHSDDFLLPGWQIQLPAGAKLPPAQTNSPTPAEDQAIPMDVTVEPGDTLSQIALDTLGDASQYPALAAANHITNPDLIHPGQIIHIPAPTAPGSDTTQQTGTDDTTAPNTTDDTETSSSEAHEPATGSSDDSDQGTASPQDDSETPTTAAGDSSATAEDETPAVESPSSEHTGSNPGEASAATSQAAPAPTAAPVVTPPVSVGNASTESAPAMNSDGAIATPSTRTLVLGGITGLTAALAWAGLLLTRRRLQQRRRPGDEPVPPLELEARVEQALRRNADTTTPRRIDRALRQATAALANRSDVVISGALIGAEAIEMRPATPADPPHPFTGTQAAWTLPLPDTDTSDEDGPERLAALPALVTIGTTGDGRIAMLNIETIGALHIGGDEARARELANHLIVELSQSPWTDGIHLHLTDRPGGLRALDEDRIQPATDLEREMRSLAAQAKTIRELLDGRSITQARTDTTYADAWEPHLLITDGNDLPADRATTGLIDQLQAGPPAAAGLITTGRNPGIAADIHVAADGSALIPAIFPDDVITAAAVTDAELAAIVGLFAASSESRADNTGHVGDTAPGDESECVEGADMIDTTAIDADLATNIVILDGNCATADLTVPDAIGVDDGHARNRPVADAVGARQTLSPDPELDSDLAEWLSNDLRRPKIAILGPAAVVGLGPAPQRPQPRQIEMAVYLALHHQGVTVDRFTDDLWPDGNPPTPGGRRVAISRLRSWLGNDPETGEAFVPNRESGYYITDRLLDSDLFTRLVHRSDRRTHAGDVREALSDLQRALALVRGPILPEAGGHEYAWLAAADRLEDRTLPVAVVDAAHFATDLALAMGDSDAAESAAMVGRSVQPYSLIPLCDLIRVAQYCGDGETAAAWARATLDAADADVPAELPEHVREHVAAALAGSGRDRLTTGARQ